MKPCRKIREMAADAENGVLSESVNGQDVTSDYVDFVPAAQLEAAEQQLVKPAKARPTCSTRWRFSAN